MKFCVNTTSWIDHGTQFNEFLYRVNIARFFQTSAAPESQYFLSSVMTILALDINPAGKCWCKSLWDTDSVLPAKQEPKTNDKSGKRS